jgi:hypothetical protein
MMASIGIDRTAPEAPPHPKSENQGNDGENRIKREPARQQHRRDRFAFEYVDEQIKPSRQQTFPQRRDYQ